MGRKSLSLDDIDAMLGIRPSSGLSSSGPSLGPEARGQRPDQGFAPATTVFASGLGRAGEIRGFSDAGFEVGVSLAPGACSAVCLVDLEGVLLRAPQRRAFIDSGAVAEVDMATGAVKRAISDAEWRRRLGVYERFARQFGPRVVVVAPDRIRDAEHTLRLLGRYRSELAQIAGAGAEILVALQGVPLGRFLDRAHAALQDSSWNVLGRALARGRRPEARGFVPAVPMRSRKEGPRRDAFVTPIAELWRFVEQRQPARIHLLGLGWKNPYRAEILAGITARSPGTVVSLDSVVLRSAIGRAGGAGGEGRPFTAARDRATEQVAEQVWGTGGALSPDWTEVAVDPAAVFTPDELATIGRRAGLPGACLRRWVADPARFWEVGEGDACWGHEEALWHALADAWRKKHPVLAVPEKVRRAIVATFGGDAGYRPPTGSRLRAPDWVSTDHLRAIPWKTVAASAAGFVVLGAAAWMLAPSSPSSPRHPSSSPVDPGGSVPGGSWRAKTRTVLERLTPGQRALLDRLAAAVPGIPITVTSAFRTPGDQADVMVAKLEAGATLDELVRLYGGSAAIREVVAVPQSRWAAVITAQMARGVFLSDHLRHGALDLSVRGADGVWLPRATQEAIVAAALAQGAGSAFVESHPPHIHMRVQG